MNYTCIHQPETDFYIERDCAALPAGTVIICKKKPFIVTVKLSVDEFLGGEIDVMYQVNDAELSYLETSSRAKRRKTGRFVLKHL